MSNIRLLLDENVNPRYRRELLRRETTLMVWRIGDPGAPPEATLDPEILVWCELHEFILVTNNRKSMPLHLQSHLANGNHVPGILSISDKVGIGNLVEELLLIASIAAAEDLRDRIVYLPLR